MAQFASVFIPFALQAATTAWQQYEQHEQVERQRVERARATEAAAEAAQVSAQASATHARQSAEARNRSAWLRHDERAAAVARETDRGLAALNRDFARTELDRADALRRVAAGERARLAGQGLDATTGSARAVLDGLGARAADQTRLAHDALSLDRRRLHDEALARIAADRRGTADETATHAHQANLDIWREQVALDSRLHELGVHQAAEERRDLFDLTASHRRAALGLTDAGVGAAMRGLR